MMFSVPENKSFNCVKQARLMEKLIYIIESVKRKDRQGDKQFKKLQMCVGVWVLQPELNNQQRRNRKWVGVNETNSH